jgi:hypothetical protein
LLANSGCRLIMACGTRYRARYKILAEVIFSLGD